MIQPSENEVTRHQPIDTHTRDKTSPVWDMSQERAFVESLLTQRFNFFLIIFSISIAGGINSKTPLHMALVLTAGALVISLLASVLMRTQEKLDLIFQDIKTDPSHPLTIIESRSHKRGSRRRLIGVWIPLFCCMTLFAAATLAWISI